MSCLLYELKGALVAYGKRLIGFSNHRPPVSSLSFDGFVGPLPTHVYSMLYIQAGGQELKDILTRNIDISVDVTLERKAVIGCCGIAEMLFESRT